MKLCYYVNQKYSSNVIDKMFDEEMIKFVLQGLMMLDNDGNYVFKRYCVKQVKMINMFCIIKLYC